MSNFAMGTILGKGFPQAQVHTNYSTSAEGTSAVMYARCTMYAQLLSIQYKKTYNKQTPSTTR